MGKRSRNARGYEIGRRLSFCDLSGLSTDAEIQILSKSQPQIWAIGADGEHISPGSLLNANQHVRATKVSPTSPDLSSSRKDCRQVLNSEQSPSLSPLPFLPGAFLEFEFGEAFVGRLIQQVVVGPCAAKIDQHTRRLIFPVRAHHPGINLVTLCHQGLSVNVSR